MAKKKTAARRGTASGKTKVRRTARPGGAPLRAAPPGKSRRVAPKLSVAAPSRQPARKPKKARAPCKYGERLANGRCPPRPTAGLAEKTLAKSTGIKLRSRSSKSIAQRAKEKVQTQIATEIAGTVGIKNVKRNVLPKVKAAFRSAEKKFGTTVARGAAPFMAAGGGIATGALALGAGIGVLRYNVARKQLTTSPAKKAYDALKQVEKNLGRRLTPDEWRVLAQQHIEFYRKNPHA